MSPSKIIADIVIANAKIYTLDPVKPWAEAAAIADGCFIATGTSAEMADFIGPDTTRRDLGGRVVLPGLFDVHCHAFEGARAALFDLALSPNEGFDELIERVGVAADALPHEAWLVGGGWEGRKLLPILSSRNALARLDEVTGNRPTVLRDLSCHCLFVNSAAMRAANIDRNTKVPENGTMVLDETGEPVGLFFENANSLIVEVMPSLDAERISSIVGHTAKMYNSFGVTGFAHAVTSETVMKAFYDADTRGVLSVRVATFISTDDLLTPEQDGYGIEVIARRQQYSTSNINVDFVKYFMDGVPASKTAAFQEPYAGQGDEEDVTTAPFFSVDELRDLIQPLDADGIHVKIHAIGDLAITHTLDAIAEVRRINGAEGPQHSIAHMSYITDADIGRLATLNVMADICPPLWFPNPVLLGNMKLLGEARGDRCWPVKDLVNSGADVAIGTDWPAIALSPNPWPGLSALITRQDPSRITPGVFRPDQALTLEETLPLYTLNPARTMGFGDVTGSIEPGKSADFSVLDRDIFTIDAVDIAETKITETFFAGQSVYRRDAEDIE